MRARIAIACACAAGLIAGGWSRPARACKCGIEGVPLSAPWVEDGEAAVVEEEEALLSCEAASRFQIACTWSARYKLVRAGGPGPVVLGVDHPPGDVVLAIDGVAVARASGADTRSLRARRRDLPTAVRTRATWERGEQAELRVTASFRVDPWQCECGLSTNHRRHPVVSYWNDADYRVSYGRESEAVDAARWRLQVEVPRSWGRASPGRFKRAGRSALATYDAGSMGGPARRVDLLVINPLRLDPGGPFVAAGVGFGPEGPAPRLRFGWELAWPQVLVHSVAVETDARRRVALIPAWELTLPVAPHWLPELGAGVGVPVQLVPDARPGVRVFGRLGYRVAHLIGCFDAYPAFRGAPLEKHGALMIQLGI